MSSAVLLMLALSGPPPEIALAALAPTADEVRKAYLNAMQQSARRSDAEPAEFIPLLTAIYREVDEVDGITHAESAQMKRHVETRLEAARGRLIRDNLRRTQELYKARLRAEKRGDARNGVDRPQLAGANELQNAQELIELIQRTIEPQSWDVNGGEGSARYFQPLMVLVIRQTGEVHHQLGGSLGMLRK